VCSAPPVPVSVSVPVPETGSGNLPSGAGWARTAGVPFVTLSESRCDACSIGHGDQTMSRVATSESALSTRGACAATYYGEQRQQPATVISGSNPGQRPGAVTTVGEQRQR